MAEYDTLLRATLRLPAVVDMAKSAGAARALHCIYKPSLDPECAVSLVQVEGRSSMTIRTLQRSVWSFFNARRGQPMGNPIVDWVEPAFAVDHCAHVEGIEALWTVAEGCSALAHPVHGLGLDGMTVQIEMFQTPGEVHRCERWFVDSTRAEDACIKLAVELRRAALAVATTNSSRAALTPLSRYMAARTEPTPDGGS
jgi:hypothetical protein